jgi:hypothetical protein
MRSFRFSNNYAIEATCGRLGAWVVKLRAGCTNNGSATGATFAAGTVGTTLLRRF